MSKIKKISIALHNLLILIAILFTLNITLNQKMKTVQSKNLIFVQENQYVISRNEAKAQSDAEARNRIQKYNNL